MQGACLWSQRALRPVMLEQDAATRFPLGEVSQVRLAAHSICASMITRSNAPEATSVGGYVSPRAVVNSCSAGASRGSSPGSSWKHKG
jgi:hypothetical protein